MKTKLASLSIVPVNDIPLALDVSTEDLFPLFRTITEMERICTDQQGIGLSAVQVGVPWKLFIVQRDGVYEYYINCTYEGVGEKQKSIEGCLSLKNDQGLRRFEVERFSNIILVGTQLKIVDSQLILENIRREEKGLYSVVFQQEIQHQEGILISDIGKEIEIM
jgi:peptide deformylase